MPRADTIEGLESVEALVRLQSENGMPQSETLQNAAHTTDMCWRLAHGHLLLTFVLDWLWLHTAAVCQKQTTLVTLARVYSGASA
jgi:hypothetical protein